MDLGIYQVVSEHSILGAQKKIRDAALEFLEEDTFNSVPEWKESLREVNNLWEQRAKGERAKGEGRRSRRDHAPCRGRLRRSEVAQKLHEIYLDHKWRMLQQLYVKAKSRKLEEGRETEKNQNGGEKLAPSVGTETKISYNTDEHFFSLATSETVESEKEKDGIAGECYSGDDEPKWDCDDEEPSSEESTPEKGHATVTLSEALIDLGETFLSREIEVCDREEKEGGEKRSDGERGGRRDVSGSEPPPEPPDEGVEQMARKEGGQFLSQSVKGCVESGNEKEACVGWSSRPLDLKFDPLGQAQHLVLTPTKILVSNSDPFNIERRLLKVLSEKKKKLVGFGLAQKKWTSFLIQWARHTILLLHLPYLLIIGGYYK